MITTMEQQQHIERLSQIVKALTNRVESLESANQPKVPHSHECHNKFTPAQCRTLLGEEAMRWAQLKKKALNSGITSSTFSRSLNTFLRTGTIVKASLPNENIIYYATSREILQKILDKELDALLLGPFRSGSPITISYFKSEALQAGWSIEECQERTSQLEREMIIAMSKEGQYIHLTPKGRTYRTSLLDIQMNQPAAPLSEDKDSSIQ